MKKYTDEEYKEYLKEEQPDFKGNPEHLRIFLEADVEGWNLWMKLNDKIDINGVKMNKADLKGAQLSKANLQKINLKGCDLQEADLSNANLEEADLTEACLKNANMLLVNLQGAILAHANLRGGILNAANLQGAYLGNADLQGCYLWEANLQDAKLSEACLQEAGLFKTNLQGAYLEEADLQGAMLLFTDLSNAQIRRIKYRKEIKKFGIVWRTKNTIKVFRGVAVDNCNGNAVFKRYAQDQDYLETFKESQPSWFYKPLYSLWKISSNCGQSMSLWILWSMIFAFAFAGIFYGLGSDAFHINPNGLKDFTFFNVLYYSIVTFTTLGFGDIVPKTTTAAMWVMAEVIVGYIMLGGLISIFATKLARRS